MDVMRGLVTIFVCIVCVWGSMAAEGRSFDRQRAADLLTRGDQWRIRESYDSALVAYRDVANMYRADLNREGKELCLRGILGSCDANLRLGRYATALDDLLMAEEICTEEGFDDSEVNLSYGMFYIVLCAQTDSKAYLRMGVPHIKRAFAGARRSGNVRLMSRSFYDLLMAYGALRDESVIRDEERMLRDEIAKRDDAGLRTRLVHLNGLRAMIGKRWGDAERSLDSVAAYYGKEGMSARGRAAALRDKAFVMGYGGKWKEGLATLEEALEISRRCDQKDLRLSCLNTRWIIAGLAGDTALYGSTRREAKALQDSLESYVVGGDIMEVENMKTRKELQRKITLSGLRNKMMGWIIAGVAAVAVVVTWLMVLLWRKNRMLRQRADMLRERMREMYRKEREEREETEEYDEAVRLDESGEEGSRRKYEGSTLTEGQKREIYASIKDVLNTDAVFGQDFSLNTLAEATGRHARAVSQVINEMAGCNFSTLVNGIRIREACRRMDSAEYSNWSIEGIAESVGFNSRKVFSSNFRKVTGLGIREYRQKG